jgi:hypothetical protein
LNVDALEERTLLATVHPFFDLSNLTHQVALTRSPFPSNVFTDTDCTQNTGLRVNLPGPDDPLTYVSDAQDTKVINTLDGFNLQPRLSIPFDGLIDVGTVSSNTVFLVSMGDTLPSGDAGGEIVGINQVVWDPETKTLHVESDQFLNQHTRYALIVTSGVHDANGDPVQASDVFTRFRHDLNFGQTEDPVLKAYRKDLIDAMEAAEQVGVPESDMVVASVFTTMSATAVLEKIRDQIHAATPAPADFLLGPGGSRTVFSRSSIGNTITWNQQTLVVGSLNPVPVNLSPLDIFPGAVGQLAFGKYHSPDYEVHPTAADREAGKPGEYIPAVATRTGTPVAQPDNEIYFNLYLPSGPMPLNGWPVAIFGHGINGSKDSGALNAASSMAAHGVATVVINAVGHGFGPGSTLTVTTAGAPYTFLAGGRGINQNRDNNIDSSEGLSATAPRGIVFLSDGFRQTAADLMQLTRVIGVGMDVDGDGGPDLDPERIYYFGNSLGGGYGTVFTAVEPSVEAGVFTVPVDPIPIGKFGVATGTRARSVAGGLLSTRQPSLINYPGIRVLDRVPVPGARFFDENLPLRDRFLLEVQLENGTTREIQSPVSNMVPGAMEIQEFIDRYEWAGQAGSPTAYAPHLRKDPLPGVPAKSVIIQIAKGDQAAPNPTTTAIVRAGELMDRTVYYRHDLARAANPSLPPNPHDFMVNIAAYGAISLGAQAQIATFFESDGNLIIQPPVVPVEFFEGVDLPIEGGLPEGLNFPGSAPAPAPAQVSGSQASGPVSTDTATATLRGVPLQRFLTAIYVTASNPLSHTVQPTSALIDRPLDDLAPLAWLEYSRNLDDLAAGLVRPARRRR